MAKRYKTKIVFTHFVTDRLNVDKLLRLAYKRGNDSVNEMYSRIKDQLTTKLNISGDSNVVNLFEVRLKQKVKESILTTDASITYGLITEFNKRYKGLLLNVDIGVELDFNEFIEDFYSIKDGTMYDKLYTDNVIIDKTVISSITDVLLPEVDIHNFELGKVYILPVKVIKSLPKDVLTDRKTKVGDKGLLILYNYY